MRKGRRHRLFPRKYRLSFPPWLRTASPRLQGYHPSQLQDRHLHCRRSQLLGRSSPEPHLALSFPYKHPRRHQVQLRPRLQLQSQSLRLPSRLTHSMCHLRGWDSSPFPKSPEARYKRHPSPHGPRPARRDSSCRKDCLRSSRLHSPRRGRPLYLRPRRTAFSVRGKLQGRSSYLLSLLSTRMPLRRDN